MARLEIDIEANIKDLNRKLNQVDNKLNNTQKSFGKLQDFAIGALSGIAAAFSISAITQFGKAVLDTTAKFQKFSAVLTNTLGSESEARIALNQISEFASKTPFAVDELTASFVKLANQGFRPTVNELRSLGDLAASTGKSFDQLAEAIIDAQVGEFERLKEFGIRAKKEGENVTFTFKGVETQVKNTEEAIRGYILSLGDAEGVSGAMASISETVGGKISNLGDNIELLKKAIGDQSSGVFAATLDWLNTFLELNTRAIKSTAELRQVISDNQIVTQLDANRKAVVDLANDYKLLDPNLSQQDAFRKAIDFVSQSFRDAAKGGEAFRNQIYTFSELEQIVSGFDDLFQEFVIGKPKIDGARASFEEFSKAADEFNRVFLFEGEQAVRNYNNSLAETERIQNLIAQRSQEIVNGQNNGVSNFELPLIDSSKLEESVSEADKKVIDGLSNMRQNAIDIANSMAQSIELGIENSIGDLAFAIGDALGSGANAFKAGGAALLGGLATILNQLGQMAIATGVAIEGIKEALTTLNPIVAIAAGVALVGLAGFVSSKAKKLGSGIGSTSSGGGGSISTGASSQSFTGTGIETNGMDISGQFVVKGSDLVYVIDRQQNKNAKG